MKIKIVSLCCCLLSLIIFVRAQRDPGYIRYVNPLIGTQKMGHTFPGATVPFGSVQLSPDTDQQPHNIGGVYNKDTYKYCAGYQYDDKSIVGFSHTHFSGTGHSDLGDFLIMPTTGALQLEPGTKADPSTGFRSAFSHTNETAEPAYYKVKLDDHNILAEMTATTRVGFHQYTFPASDNAHVILDLMHGIYNYDDKNVWTFVRVENDHTIVGYRQTNGWARTRTVYFAMEFSKPFSSYGFKNFGKEDYKGFWRKFDQTKNFPEAAGKQIRAYFDFNTTEGEKVKLKFALSPVSTAGAMANLKAEVPHWDFERTKREGQAEWNKELSKVAVTALDDGEMTNFYTALYHAMLTPTVYMDTDGQYKGIDQNVHRAWSADTPVRMSVASTRRNADESGGSNGRDTVAGGTGDADKSVRAPFTNYTTFSLWDTYRALHPLLNIIQPARNRDMVRSMQAHYDQSVHKMLPVWSHYANENWCMIGYHSVSVVADAVVKGNLTGAEAMKALEASAQTARTKYYDGLEYYMQMGYVPDDKNSSSVSKTLEYAYDDWAIAQMAKKLGRNDLYDEFIKRSENWRNHYDPSNGFMRPKMSDGNFRKEFDPLSTHGQGFIEGNAWNYSLYVPHNPAAMIEMMGGKAKFTAHMDKLFTMHLPDEFFAETEDITREGIIGNYVHGNEPAHHAAYLYNWTDDAWKTQERVRMILKNQYRPTPDGLGGNDDCGQMSAWYIFTALGFYPVAPGSDQYALGSPVIKTATLKLENGKTLTIEAVNQSDRNVYVTSVTVNGQKLNRNHLLHSEITNGGKIVFQMSDKPPVGSSILREIVRRMGTHYNAMSSLKANVSRTEQSPHLPETDNYSGTLVFVPGIEQNPSIRLEWIKPRKEILSVTRGKYKLYVPGIMTEYRGMTRGKGEKPGGSLFDFLYMSPVELKANFTMAYEGRTSLDGVDVWQLRFEPRTVRDYKLMEMWVDANGMPLQARIIALDRTIHTVKLSEIELNSPISNSVFTVSLAKGTKIVSQ